MLSKHIAFRLDLKIKMELSMVFNGQWIFARPKTVLGRSWKTAILQQVCI